MVINTSVYEAEKHDEEKLHILAETHISVPVISLFFPPLGFESDSCSLLEVSARLWASFKTFIYKEEVHWTRLLLFSKRPASHSHRSKAFFIWELPRTFTVLHCLDLIWFTKWKKHLTKIINEHLTADTTWHCYLTDSCPRSMFIVLDL